MGSESQILLDLFSSAVGIQQSKGVLADKSLGFRSVLIAFPIQCLVAKHS